MNGIIMLFWNISIGRVDGYRCRFCVAHPFRTEFFLTWLKTRFLHSRRPECRCVYHTRKDGKTNYLKWICWLLSVAVNIQHAFFKCGLGFVCTMYHGFKLLSLNFTFVLFATVAIKDKIISTIFSLLYIFDHTSFCMWTLIVADNINVSLDEVASRVYLRTFIVSLYSSYAFSYSAMKLSMGWS